MPKGKTLDDVAKKPSAKEEWLQGQEAPRRTRRKPQKYKYVYAFRTDPDLIKRMKRYCLEHDKDVQDYLNELLDQDLKKDGF